jgi:hypothetical protein
MIRGFHALRMLEMAIEFEARHSKIQPLLGDFALLHHAWSQQQIHDREFFYSDKT